MTIKDPFNPDRVGKWGAMTETNHVLEGDPGWLELVLHYLAHGQPLVVLCEDKKEATIRIVEYLAGLPAGRLRQSSLSTGELACIGKAVQDLMGSLIYLQETTRETRR